MLASRACSVAASAAASASFTFARLALRRSIISSLALASTTSPEPSTPSMNTFAFSSHDCSHPSTAPFSCRSQSLSCPIARSKSFVSRFRYDSASSLAPSMARLGSSRMLSVSFVSASSAPLNLPHRSTLPMISLSSSPSASHSSLAFSISSKVRGRSMFVCTESFSNSAAAFSICSLAFSVANDARSMALSAGAMTTINAAAHAATEPSAKSPTAATRFEPVGIVTTAAGAFAGAVTAVALREPRASCETAGLPDAEIIVREDAGETYASPEISSGNAATTTRQPIVLDFRKC
mmetsp:Transcript_1920/g.8031  ORF Transcript_1920/g.8031 Transcript_1920/m.8031 type:complete len:294 (+) Transcript_1920:296-1177(+)